MTGVGKSQENWTGGRESLQRTNADWGGVMSIDESLIKRFVSSTVVCSTFRLDKVAVNLKSGGHIDDSISLGNFGRGVIIAMATSRSSHPLSLNPTLTFSRRFATTNTYCGVALPCLFTILWSFPIPQFYRTHPPAQAPRAVR